MGIFENPALYDAGVSKTTNASARDQLMVEGRIPLGLLLPMASDCHKPAECTALPPSLAAYTQRYAALARQIALGTAAIIAPLEHGLHLGRQRPALQRMIHA